MTTAGWFGAIPERWDAVPLYGIASERKIPNKGLSETNLLSLSYGRIVRKDIETNEGLLPASFETYQIVRPDDIVLRMTDLQNDQRSLRSALVRETGIITSAYLALALRNVDPRFMAYQFRAIDLMKVFYSMGGGLRQSIGFSDLKRLPVLTPPVEEQRAIADYLDRETAQIDAFIAKNEELITLLNERRAAAVNAPFAREEPNARLSHACEAVVDCPHTTPEVDDDGDFEAVRTASVRAGVYVPGQGLTVSEATWRSRNGSLGPRRGDVLFTREAPAGEACMVPSAEICLGQRMVLLRIDSAKADGQFLLWQLYSREVQSYFELAANGSTVTNIRLPLLRSAPIWLPSLEEQRRVSDAVGEQVAAIDNAIGIARRGIALARDRRAALISAAVTGKIDVGVAV
ncbi:hypothetical protein R8Z57_01285 [Microbacterium sp. M3]|uniref:Restriction endonuclease subunit S n=1 Tax=Microbacterium arthrosphaerae TaxID=792652 RepID=A0ABU4GWF8_9MICO|nr:MULTISPECIES: hypothetical protein [Microbacterium]MDW4571406.1 hypothetical protein [Microbacterium arthrosphaerae]MDW7605261.1 hypothetical protein [Microbacterium sp. M3]